MWIPKVNALPLLLPQLREHPRAEVAAAKSRQSCPTLSDPVDGSPPGSPIPGILQARTLEWVAISFSNAWKWKVKGKFLSHVWLSDPMDCSLPGSSVHGIFQARVLEWGAIAFSDITCLFNLYAEYIMWNAGLDEAQGGIRIAGRNINNFRYADDITLLFLIRKRRTKGLLIKVKEESEKAGLKLKIQKS